VIPWGGLQKQTIILGQGPRYFCFVQNFTQAKNVARFQRGDLCFRTDFTQASLVRPLQNINFRHSDGTFFAWLVRYKTKKPAFWAG